MNWIFCTTSLLTMMALFHSCRPSDTASDQAVQLKINDSLVNKNVLTPRDVSQMDMSYCPFDYPFLKMQGKAENEPLARVIYGRPHKKGRPIFGSDSSSLCMYGTVWRMGANEATEIEFFSDALFNRNPVKKGRYVMYCIPNETSWKIRLNSNCYSWGLQIDSAKDVLETEVPTEETDNIIEDLTIQFQPSDRAEETLEQYELNISWDRTYVNIPVSWKIKN